MPPQYRRFATLLPYLQQLDPAGGGTPPATPPADPPEPDDTPLGDAGKAALDAEREARRLADKRAKDAEKKLADLEDARVKAEDDKAKEQGEWKTLAEKREADLTTTTAERDDLLIRVETLEALANNRLTAILKDIPKDIAELGPDTETPIEKRLAWAEKAAKATNATGTTPGNGPNPKPAGTIKPEIKGVLPQRQYVN